MSAATMRPLALHGPVKSSLVMITTFPVRDARDNRPDRSRPGRVVDEVGLRLGDAVRTALDAAAGDQDRIPRPLRSASCRCADRATGPGSRSQAGRPDRSSTQCRSRRHRRRASSRWRTVVAPEVDRLGEHLRLGRVAEIGDPHRPAVAARAGRKGPEIGEVVPACRTAGPHVVAAVDAADRVARGQVDEVAHLLEVLGILVGDDVEARAAVRIAGLRSERADPRTARLVDVVVAVGRARR